MYSIVFWNEVVGDAQMEKYQSDDVKFMVDHVERINSADDLSIEKQQTEDKLL